MPFRKTLRDNERALTVSKDGTVQSFDGPQRISVFRKRLIKLQRISASQKEYIRVEERDGTIKNIPGPSYIYINPFTTNNAEVMESISLDANEVLVVYCRDRSTNKVTRKIQYGPMLFIPDADEWLHEFVWHGTDRQNKTQKIPGALRFTKLRVIPDQFYYNIKDVRTKDDALITVKVMIFFELRDIDTMLNQTTDPIGDFINALTADVIAFGSQLTLKEFVDNTGQLNILDNYSQLRERSKAIGYEVSKVVYRGFQCNDKLQRLLSTAMERRTALRIQMESDHQEQDLTDAKLQNEIHRNEIEQKIKLEELKHHQELAKLEKVHNLQLQEKEYMERLKRKKAEEQAKQENKKKLDQQQLEFLSQLHGLGVNVTEYLISQRPKPDQVMRVVTTSAGGTSAAPTVHIHP